MRTIFAIAATAEKLRTLLASLELNGVPLQNITVVMPGDETAMVPADAAGAKAVADDFVGNPKRALMGGAIGALVGMGALALSVLPGLVAIGAGVVAMGAVVSGGAGGALGALDWFGTFSAGLKKFRTMKPGSKAGRDSSRSKCLPI